MTTARSRPREGPVPRQVKPRATSSLAIAPALVTDLTAPAVVGLEPWQFRELVKAEGIAHARIGQRVTAKVADVVAAVDRIAKRQSSAPADDDAAEPAKAGSKGDRILARLGRVRTAG
jgi:hypothetical protein